MQEADEKRSTSRAERVLMIESQVDGVPVIMTEFGYKTFSMVVKSLGWFTKRISPTYLCTSGVMETKFGQPEVRREYPASSASYILDLYNGVRPDCALGGLLP